MSSSSTRDPDASNGSVRPPAGGGDTGSGSAERSGRRTLPPPEWVDREGPRSASALVLASPDELPLERRHGRRAVLASLKARFTEAQMAGDPDRERHCAAGLARALAQRGIELELATKLARRALLLGDDVTLRDELSSWFAGLGEPALAAVALRPLLSTASGVVAAQILTRIAVLLARADDAAGAADALLGAIAEDPQQALPAELLGGLAAWSNGAVAPDRAADAYLEAVRRRERASERAQAFDDLLRAFEIAPHHAGAAMSLAEALSARGRDDAADEVLRAHGNALGVEGAAVHAARMGRAFSAGDTPGALGAALDARLEIPAELDIDTIEQIGRGGVDATHLTFDSLLERLGLVHFVAARLEAFADRTEGAVRASVLRALGRLCSSVLGNPERAIWAWMNAFALAPDDSEARAAVWAHAAAAGDYGPAAEGLLRAADSALTPGELRGACYRELAALADGHLGDPSLALWAVERALELAPGDSRLVAEADRLRARADLREQEITALRADVDRVRGEQRLDALERLAELVLHRPDHAPVAASVLGELAVRRPGARRWVAELERLLERAQLWSEWRDLLRSLPAPAAGSPEAAARATLLSALARRRGDFDAALVELEPQLADGDAGAACHALMLASELGQEQSRARALTAIGGALSAPMRAVLAAAAAESHLAAGDAVQARATADAACRADPSSARAVATRAWVALEADEPADAEALERAVGRAIPRARLCTRLAEIHRASAPALALVWTQRHLVLRPGDPDAARALLEQATAVGEPARLAESLVWLLSQPQPLTGLTDAIVDALLAISAVDPARAAAVARRALNVLGPASEALRRCAVEIADRSGEHDLACSVLERWLAAGASESDRSAVLFELVRRRRAAGDHESAARDLARAALEGADPVMVLAELDRAAPPQSGDGELALLQARAEALVRLAGADPDVVQQALRNYGAAVWDLADDRDAAFDAWERVADRDSDRGVTRLAGDLAAFAGSSEAFARLEASAARRVDPKATARLLTAAAMVALDSERHALALTTAARALELDPQRVDAIAVAERAAHAGDTEQLDGIYRRLADAALGRYGERAAHYRAARQLERRGDLDRALGHAVAAFECVPAEGVTLALMTRLARRFGRTLDAAAAIERVATATSDADQRASWLTRGAGLADGSEGGLRQRVDLLFQAFAVRPGRESLAALASAVSHLVAALPSEIDVALMRFRRAIEAALGRLDGPEGARVAIEATLGALGVFDAVDLAWTSFERAVACDGDIEEYQRLTTHVSMLIRDRDAAQRFVQRTIAIASDKFASSGRALLELGGTIARQIGDAESCARLLVAASAADPEDRELHRRALEAVRISDDPVLAARIVEAAPASARPEVLLDLARERESAGEISEAIELLENALGVAPPAHERHAAVVKRLGDLYRRQGRRGELESLLTSELERSDLEPAMLVRLSVELGALLAARGDAQRALEVLTAAERVAPDDPSLLGDMANLARQADDKERQAAILEKLIRVVEHPGERAGLLRDRAELLEQIGRTDLARGLWEQVLKLEPRDPVALAGLERDAEARGDYASVVELLARRAAQATLVDEVRRIRLRRAVVLDQHLGRTEEARTELEALLAATGENLPTARLLADVNERLNSWRRAAMLWSRALRLAGGGEWNEICERMIAAWLAAGDADAARSELDALGDRDDDPDIAALRVQVERRSGNSVRLAAALDRYAAMGPGSDVERSRLFAEAAHAFLAGGELEQAADRARRAAELDPSSATLCVLRHWIDHLAHGVGGPEQARIRVADLRSLPAELDTHLGALRALLVAEALDVVVGRDAGMRELFRAEEQQGPQPLIALGIAERLARAGEHQAALASFDRALSGDLARMRSRGEVALGAAQSARAAGELQRALRYATIAAEEPDTEQRAIGLRGALLAVRNSIGPGPADQAGSRHPATLDVPRSADAERDRPAPEVLDRPELGKPVRTLELVTDDEPEPGDRVTPHEFLELPHPAEQPVAPQGRYSARPDPEVITQAPRSVRLPVPHDPGDPVPIDEPFERDGYPPIRSERPPSSPRVRQLRRPTPSSGSRIPVAAEADPVEVGWYAELEAGSADAARALIARLESHPERAHDLVNVCRKLTLIEPGNRWALEKLYAAASADHDYGYARAIEHVLKTGVDPDPAIEAPGLHELVEDPDSVRSLLLRDTSTPGLEALGLVWEAAEHVFRRDPTAYGVTGLERVPLGAPTSLGRAFATTARALGMSKTPLFLRRTLAAPSVSVALMSPPSVIVSGEVTQESSELRYHLGAMLAGALPQHVLVYGSPEAEVRAVLRALLLVFGPPGVARDGIVAAANLAEVLWESVPARSQRRLRELCREPSDFEYDAVVAAAHQATRRAGLFACGDLRIAIREACAAEGDEFALLGTRDGIERLCAASGAISDLVVLATSPVYARTRWGSHV